MKMRSSQKLTIFTFLALVISSFASDGSQISVSPSLAPAPGPSGLNVGSTLKEWCNSTDYPDICVSAIAPFMNGKPDLFRAIEIGMKSSVATTKSALLAATKMANSPLTSQELASILKDSLDSFNDALYNYQEAQDALVIRDWGTVNTMLSGAISDFGDCDDQLKKENMPMLKEFINKLTKMTSNCLALSALFDPPPGYDL